MSPRGRPKIDKGPKRKAVKVRLVPREHAGQVTEPYEIMERIIAADRADLADVRIGLAWHLGWRPDADGGRTHGKCLKRTDLDRTLDGYDFLIILSESSWKAFDDRRKERLLFHELEHAQVAIDKNGTVMLDDKNRIVTRIKRHDLGDFRSVIERYGLPECLSDIEIADADRPLLKLAEQQVKPSALAEDETTKDTKDTKPLPEGQEWGDDEPWRDEVFELHKIHGLKKAGVVLTLFSRAGLYRYALKADLGNYSLRIPAGTSVTMKAFALNAVDNDLHEWLDKFPITGTADNKRASQRRVEIMREAVGIWLEDVFQTDKS